MWENQFKDLNLPFLPYGDEGDQHFGLAVTVPGNMPRLIARTNTYGEMVEAMEKVAPHLPEGTLIASARYWPTGRKMQWFTQVYLRTQIGRQHRLIAR